MSRLPRQLHDNGRRDEGCMRCKLNPSSGASSLAYICPSTSCVDRDKRQVEFCFMAGPSQAAKHLLPEQSQLDEHVKRGSPREAHPQVKETVAIHVQAMGDPWAVAKTG